jgi:hypothetical protein
VGTSIFGLKKFVLFQYRALELVNVVVSVDYKSTESDEYRHWNQDKSTESEG